MLELLAFVGLAFALLPLALALRNLQVFHVPTLAPPAGTQVSLLVPARDEAQTIDACLDALLASRGVEIEVVVLDDQSSDGTDERVRARAALDPRVRLVTAPPLPPGWAGKQRACALLAEQARHPVLMFIDADVRVAPDAAAHAAAWLLRDPQLGLVSGFPREVTRTWAEQLVVPWIHVLLLGYLPMDGMRRSRSPGFGAACGQWVVARSDAYRACGGHAASPLSRHDGTSLPRTFRAAGWRTDLFDGTPLASCRMYTSLATVWAGFGKSAGEGLATPLAFPVWAVLIGFGHVLPWVTLPLALWFSASTAAALSTAAVAANVLLRLLLRRRFEQSRLSTVLHPVGALLTLALNAWALGRHLRGRPSAWRGRQYLREAGRVQLP